MTLSTVGTNIADPTITLNTRAIRCGHAAEVRTPAQRSQASTAACSFGAR